MEQQARSRSTFQMAAFIVALHVVVLGGFLFLGCKKEENQTPPTADTFASPPPVHTDSFSAPPTDSIASSNSVPPSSVLPPVTNATAPTNEAVIPPPYVPPTLPPQGTPTTAQPAGGTEYVVKKGDTGAGIAKKHGASLKQLQELNSGKDLAKLKIGDKIQVPAAAAHASTAPAPSTPHGTTAKGTGTTYLVKGGDNLSKLAKKFGTTAKAIRDANGLKSNEIRVGQKLVIPGKAGAADAASEPAAASTSSTPVPPPSVTPVAPPSVTPVNPVGSQPTPQ